MSEKRPRATVRANFIAKGMPSVAKEPLKTPEAAGSKKKEVESMAESKKTTTKKTKAEPAKKETAAKAEEAVKEEAAKKAAVKAEEKKEPEKKEPVKKEIEKAAKKPSTEKKDELKVEVTLQFNGNDYTEERLVKSAQDVWVYDLGRNTEDFKSVQLFVKPEDGKAYVVVNGDEEFSFNI